MTERDMPDFLIEDRYDTAVCGLDEAGRGPLAGPVVTACVFIPPEKRSLDFVSAIKDSKKLSPARLEELYSLVRAHFIWGITEASVADIDTLNILQATMMSMSDSFESMLMSLLKQGSVNAIEEDARFRGKGNNKSFIALIDGTYKPREFPCEAVPVKKGDDISTSIAAASILAKVTRDRIMADLDKKHPHYGWASNVGYPSPAHKDAINKHGITEHHRRGYAPVRNYIEFGHTDGQSDSDIKIPA